MTEENNANDSSAPVPSGTVLHAPGDTLPVTVSADGPDLGAGKPLTQIEDTPKPRPLQHAIVKACGHKLDIQHVPVQSNCDFCWEAYFTLRFDAAGIGQLHRMLVEDGRVGMERVLGKKFVKMFGKFLQWQLWAHQNEDDPPVEIEPTIEGAQMAINAERRENGQ